VVEANEIKKYLNCRYVFALEATWRIFKFDMHERFPAIEHLQSFRYEYNNDHVPNQQIVLFDDDDVQEWQQVSHFQNNVPEMVQNKPRIKSCTKLYLRSIPSTMGVESKIKVMDNAQERFCHWSHVLCTPDIG